MGTSRKIIESSDAKRTITSVLFYFGPLMSERHLSQDALDVAETTRSFLFLSRSAIV